jgi:hypothetical protein
LVLSFAFVVALVFPVRGAVDFGGYRPHYQGYGADSRGGRGGAILRVTNLDDSGPGSLRAALEAAGPRFVIFETSGTIVLNGPIFVTSPYVTIAGQTAPSPGISVRNWPIYFDTHDVVVQHIRLRMGDLAQPGPGQFVAIGAGLNNAHHIVFDHVSVAWTMYQAFFFCNYQGNGPNPTNTTIVDSLFAFGLVTASPSNTGMGGLYCGGSNGTPSQHTEARNLYVHNAHRQPQLSPGTRLSVVNNVVYGSGPHEQAEDYAFLMAWMSTCGNTRMDSNPALRIEAVVVNTVTIPSIGTGRGTTAGSDDGNRSFFMVLNENNLLFQQNRFWFSGNQGPFITGPSGPGQWAGVFYSSLCGGIPGSEAALGYQSEPSWHAGFDFQTIPADRVAEYVFGNAGARPLDRDPVDRAAVAQARAGLAGDIRNMGTRLRSQDDMGGHPTLAQNIRRLVVPSKPHAVASGQKFRTTVEMWLEAFAQALEPAIAGEKKETPAPPRRR